MAPGFIKRGGHTFRVEEPAHCCIACGRRFTVLESPTSALDEREDRRNLEKNYPLACSYMANADDIESMYFHKKPWIWACFYRAIVHRPHIDYVGISGIAQSFAQEFFPHWGDDPRLPRDPQKALIGYWRIIPEASLCTPFWTADVLHPENNQTAPLEQISYPVHAHCWILVDRIIGLELIKADLKLFLIAVERFWAENPELWGKNLLKRVGYEPDSDQYEYGSETEREVLIDRDFERRDQRRMPIWENPTIVPRIQEIIEQATQSHSESRPQRTPSSLLSHVPLDIAIQIVEFSKVAGIGDTRNMLAAFGWRLPNSYWKSRCKMDLIFEYADLHKTNCPVDWQFIGLATEELMEDPIREHNTGLGTRRWIFRQLEQIKTIFLNLLEQEKLNPGCLIEPARRKYPLRKRLL